MGCSIFSIFINGLLFYFVACYVMGLRVVNMICVCRKEYEERQTIANNPSVSLNTNTP